VTVEEVGREIEERWAQAEGQAGLTLGRLVVELGPDSAALERARARADTALQGLRAGGDFAVVVRRYSQDPGSRDREGDLGWIRRSEVLPSFGDAAWRAPLGRPVGPVETRYGYHVMEVQNVRGGERKIRHVLVRPEFDETDREEARRRAAAVADSLRQGADFDRMSERYSDLPANRETRVEIPVQEVRSRLGPDYAEALEGARSGDVVGPIEISGTQAETAFAVVQVTNYRSSGRYELNEVRDQIREGLAQQKQYRRFLDRLRDDIYVKILI
jgi:parvulin-like peptidyl-prolyl isomerase